MAVGTQLKLPKFNYKVTADQREFLRTYGPVVAKLRRNFTFAARLLHGIVVPPHQRQIWRLYNLGFRENHLVGGRGTSKSASVASIAATLEVETRVGRKVISLSSSKFRGGKNIMEEAVDFILGRMRDQRPPAPFAAEMARHKAVVKREGDRWTIGLRTNSTLTTIPTGNLEATRGNRAHKLILDEADNWQRDDVAKYLEPFLAVESSFEETGESASTNAIWYTGTVTYAHTSWARTLQDREKLIYRRFQAQMALQNRDYETYHRLMEDDDGRLKTLSVGLQRWDYTDLIIPEYIGEYKVYFPAIKRGSNKVEVNPEWMTRWDVRDKQKYIYVYPFDKSGIEAVLDDGLVDLDMWAAENRCQFIRTSGTVYSPELLEKATKTELLDYETLAKNGWNVEERGPYYPPLLYECKAPCVLGVDPARSADFSAFVVIRLGELEPQSKPYNPFTGEGYTPWNNVIWAEAHRGLSTKEIAQKIRELKERYNLYIPTNPELAYAVAIDARGTASGTVIRDELAKPSPDTDEFGNLDPNWTPPQLIYDPTDKEYRRLANNSSAWPGLRIIWSTDALNTEWVTYSKGQLEQNKLFIARWVSYQEREEGADHLIPGYLGVQSLVNQLMKIEAEPTKYYMKYLIRGSEKSIENKDDLFKAFLYAIAAVRTHLSLQTHQETKTPAPVVLTVRPRGRKINNPFFRI